MLSAEWALFLVLTIFLRWKISQGGKTFKNLLKNINNQFSVAVAAFVCAKTT